MDSQQTFEIIKLLNVNTKFELNGKLFIVCEHKRNSLRKYWSDELCKVVTCSALPLIPNNNVLVLRTNFGKVVVKNV